MSNTEILPTNDPAGAQIAALRAFARGGHIPTDEELRELWRVAGGTPPHPDWCAMKEKFLLPLLRTLLVQS